MPLTSDTLWHRRSIPTSGPTLAVRLRNAYSVLAIAPTIPASPLLIIRRAALRRARPSPHALRAPTAAAGADLPVYVPRTR